MIHSVKKFGPAMDNGSVFSPSFPASSLMPATFQRLHIFLIAPDLRTLGGFERQMSLLAARLSDQGHRVHVFLRDHVAQSHPYLPEMVRAGATIHAPTKALEWMFCRSRVVRELFVRFSMVAATPIIIIAAAADALARRRSLLRSWRGAKGRLSRLLEPVRRFDERLWSLGRRMDRQRRAQRPDLVDVQHSMIPFGIDYAASHGIPIVYTEYGAPSPSLASVWIGLRSVIDKADLIIGRAHASISGLREVCGLHADVSWLIVPNAVMAVPDASEMVEWIEPPGTNGTFVLTIGRLAPEKNPLLMLTAMRALLAEGLDIRLIFAGDGPLRSELQAKCREWNMEDRVIFTGAFKDLAPILRAAHIVAHSTLNDGRSISVLEAMAWAKPVVATSVGGLTEIIENDVTGYLVPPNAALEMASVLKKLANDSNLRRRIGQAARESFLSGGYTADRMVEGTLMAYRRLLDKSPRVSLA